MDVVLRAGVPARLAAGLLAAGALVAPAQADAAVRLCQGEEVTVEAAASDTTVVGTEGPDVIDGIGRNRLTIRSLGGDDVVCTGPGAAIVVHGGPGADRIQSDAAVVEVHGDEGDDVIVLGAGGGRVTGGAGDDRVDARSAENGGEVVPGPGDDAVVGSGTTGVVFGGTDGVRISAASGTADGEGHDTFSGVRWLTGSPASDVFVGSAGADYYLSEEFPYRDTAAPDVASGGAGDDALLVTGRADGGPGNDTLNLLGEGGTALGGPGRDALVAFSGTLRGGPGPDGLQVSSTGTVPVRAYGEGGEDSISVQLRRCSGGSVCRAVVDGGEGADRFRLWTEDDRGVRVDLTRGRARSGPGRVGLTDVEHVVGSSADDVLVGSRARDRLSGIGGDDVLVGRGGRDRLLGGLGRDRAVGGAGRDVCRAEVRRSC